MDDVLRWQLVGLVALRTLTGSLGAIVSIALPWLGTVALGIATGLLGWSLATYVPKKFGEPQTSIVSVALLIGGFPILLGFLWVVMVTQAVHPVHLLGIYAGAGIVFFTDRFTLPSRPLET